MHCFKAIAAGSIDQLVMRAAIGTGCLAGLFYWQINTRVRIPQLLLRRGAGQRKFGPVHLIGCFFVGVCQAGISGVCGMCHNWVSKNRTVRACTYSTVPGSWVVIKIQNKPALGEMGAIPRQHRVSFPVSVQTPRRPRWFRLTRPARRRSACPTHHR